MASVILSTLQNAYITSLKSSKNAFEASIRQPESTQRLKLNRTIADNRLCAYGIKNKFSEINSVKKFQSTLPIVGYDEMEPYIDKIRAGYQNVLTQAPIKMLEKSGGSTATTKYIPYTQTLLDEFSAATNPWIYDLYRSNPTLKGTKSYWSISPISHKESKTDSGIPIGFEEESEYFNPLARFVLNRMFAVPSSVRLIENDQAWKEATAVHLLNEENLGLISVWSPTFLSVLMNYIAENASSLKSQLRKPAKHRLQKAREESDTINGEVLWPNLSIISCWTDGISASFSQELRAFFPNVFIQGKGLLATEGVISIPWRKQNALSLENNISSGGLLAINSHFYEFIDLNDERATPKLAHELQRDGIYSPVITTGGGLYRYHLKDVIECTGFTRNAPEIRFLNKLDRTSDLCGEKIHANQVDQALKIASAKVGINIPFALLSPNKTAPLHYTLFLESQEQESRLIEFGKAFEAHLETGHHYSYCKQRGQLSNLQVKRVSNGWKQYQNHLVEQGQRLGDIKPTHLETRFDWNKIFESWSTQS